MKLPKQVGFIFIVIVLTFLVNAIRENIIENNKALKDAQHFVMQNQRLQDDIGEIKDFGWWSNSNTKAGSGVVWLQVVGTKKTQNVALKLTKCTDGNYKVIIANYENSLGQTVQLAEHTP